MICNFTVMYSAVSWKIILNKSLCKYLEELFVHEQLGKGWLSSDTEAQIRPHAYSACRDLRSANMTFDWKSEILTQGLVTSYEAQHTSNDKD